ncbi:MAG: DUF3987 domain-containing protein [Desulfobacterales bacterium]
MKITEELNREIQQKLAKTAKSQTNGQDLFHPKPFPFHIYPKKLQDILRIWQERDKLNLDMMCAANLYTWSVDSGNNVRFDTPTGWLDIRASLYMAIVAPKGTRKSPSLYPIIRPLIELSSEEHERYKGQAAAYEADPENEQKPEPRKTILTNDLTIESIAPELVKNSRGMGIYREELAGMLRGLNKYNRGDSDLYDYCSIWDGHALDVIRKKDDPIRVDNAFVSIMGSIQPRVLVDITNTLMYDSGFVDRMLFVLPTGMKEITDYEDRQDISNPELDEYKRIVKRSYGEWSGACHKVAIQDPEARKLYIDFVNDSNRQLTKLDDDSPLRGTMSKLGTYFPKFVLLSHAIHTAFTTDEINTPVSIEHVQNGIDLVEYFRYNNSQVVDSILNRNPFDQLPLNKRRFYEALPATFEAKDAFEAARGFSISRRTVSYFLSDKSMFVKPQYGWYEKVYQ